MPRANHCHLAAVAVTAASLLLLAAAAEASSCVGFDLHHRTSPVVRRWAEARGHPLAARRWPAHASLEYYSLLSRHDRALLARRGLAGADGLLTFADGNDTFTGPGSLHYAEVALGTPNATFLVALDTGSDLLWVPCDCKQCAPLSSNRTSGAGLRPYSPSLSTTSKPVTCGQALCGQPSTACGAATNGSCPYQVRYVSANTSSSGVLVQDVLHLTRAAEAVPAPVVFGCGQVQTGSFLDGAAADGLLGLGMDSVSVPSVLAASGVVKANSFSMCFSDDGAGRINFGDAGSPGQAETPFVVRATHPTYNVSFTSINVGNKSAPVEFAAIMDSGTSFTYLNEPEYSELATNVKERRTNFSSGDEGQFPFEYCYSLSPNQSEVSWAYVSLTARGGALFPVTRPIVLLAGEINGRLRPLGYCLAIIKNDISINIIGQNFMTGLKVVFDRERLVLGWQEFDCYKNVRAAADAPEGSPRAAPGPRTRTPRQEDAGSNSYPGAAPVPPSAAGSRGVACTSLLLPLLLAAALVI